MSSKYNFSNFSVSFSILKLNSSVNTNFFSMFEKLNESIDLTQIDNGSISEINFILLVIFTKI